MKDTPLIIEARWLAEHLLDSGIQILEISEFPESYNKAHIRGALAVPGHHYLKKFDSGKIRTHHVIDESEFRDLAHALGLKQAIHYVVYDDNHGLWAARFWSVCRHYGVDNVSLLDGSWHGWLSEGLPVDSQTVEPTTGSDLNFAVRSESLIDCDQFKRDLADPDVLVWDCRRPEEFSGTEDTGNERQGHVPGALHLPWTDLLTGEDIPGAARHLKSAAEMEQLLSELGLQRDKTVVTYCQAGIRAAFCQLMLVRLGYTKARLYDASMQEWCNRSDTPLTS